jgi:hypothetical protein
MSNQHNKKRNVGIIYEQLLRRTSAFLLENNEQKATECMKITRKYFKPGSELYREFRLFQALLNTTTKSEPLAVRILEEARRGARMFSQQQLDIEKSRLIREINHTLDDPEFFNQPVKEYRLYATIQTLINDWRRSDDASLLRVADYEQKLVEWLSKDKLTEPEIEEMVDESVNALSVKLMTEKFEKKWSGKLTHEQASLIKDYVMGRTDVNLLETTKRRVVRGLQRLKESTESTVLLEKIDHINKQVSEIDVSRLDDDTVVKFMQLTQLQRELETKDE